MDVKDIKFKPLLETLEVKKIDDAEYFSDGYSKYISNSRLSGINPEQGGSPEKFFGKMGGLYTDSIILGSAVHTMVLQPDYFELVDTCRPTAKLGFVCDYIYDHATDPEHKYSIELLREASDTIDYYKGKVTQTVINKVVAAYEPYRQERLSYTPKEGITPMFLGHNMYNQAQACIQACNTNKEFQKILHPEGFTEEPISENELAFLLDIKCDLPDQMPLIVKLKSKLDNFTINKETNEIVVNDLKTLGNDDLSAFDGEEGNFGRFHYHRELAIYTFLLKMYAEKEYGITNPTIRINCLVVSTRNYSTKVYSVSKLEALQGMTEFRNLLGLVAYCKVVKGYDFR